MPLPSYLTCPHPIDDLPTQGPEFCPGGSFDGSVKLTHYWFAGTASAVPPALSSYLSQSDREVERMVQDGTFGLGSLLERARGTSLGEGRTDQGEPCAGKTTLVCSRPEAATSVAPLDRNGIIGGVCRHGVPLRGCFTDLRTPDPYHDAIQLLHQYQQPFSTSSSSLAVDQPLPSCLAGFQRRDSVPWLSEVLICR